MRYALVFNVSGRKNKDLWRCLLLNVFMSGFLQENLDVRILNCKMR